MEMIKDLYTKNIQVITDRMTINPKLLPKWLMQRYLVLWKVFGESQFSFAEAEDELDDNSRVIALVLSELDKFGWIKNIEANPKDKRKKLYQLVPFEKGIERITKEVMAR